MEGGAPVSVSHVSGGSLRELKKSGQKVVRSPHHAPILLVYHDGEVYAVDNRCPHMGFPLDRGSVEDGILTCHWHHARFCLASGGTFDPFADDLRSYPVTIDGDQIWIELRQDTDLAQYWKRRLEEGLRHNINLVIAKAVTALVDLEVDVRQIAEIGARHGSLHRRAWGPGLTILTAMCNLSPDLPQEDKILALYQGLVFVSRDTANQPARFSLGPLSASESAPSTVERHKTWFRHFVHVRDEEGAERTLLTAIVQGADAKTLADMLITAATDHVYLDVGHVVDFINKSLELLDLVGWDHAEQVLPTLVPVLCRAQRAEELGSWRRPIDLIALLDDATAALSADPLGPTTNNDEWQGSPLALSEKLLAEDPKAVLDAVTSAYREGATPKQLARALALAAARRVLQFHTQNEFTDWDAVHHTFTYANALYQILLRAPSTLALRGVLHGALRVYLDRFLNVPVARIRPKLVEEERLALTSGATYRQRLENLLDHADNVDRAGALTTAAFEGDEPISDRWAALVMAVVREDAAFHTLQMVEAARRQFDAAETDEEREIVMVAASRYIAAHAPTHRQLRQTARVAMRLHAGEALHEEEAVDVAP